MKASAKPPFSLARKPIIFNEKNIVWFCTIAVFITLILTINVGFDLRDEGFYFTGYDRQQRIFFEYSGFHFFARLLPFSDNIIINRLYRLFFLAIAALILSLSLTKNKYTKKSIIIVFGYCIIGNLLTYLLGPPSLSYNIFNLFFLEILIAIHLIIFQKENRISGNKEWTLLIIYAITLGLFSLNKITSAFVFVFIIILDLLFFRPDEILRSLKKFFIIGIIALLVFGTGMFLMYHGRLHAIYELLKTKSFYGGDNHQSKEFLLAQIFINPIKDSDFIIIFIGAYFLWYILSRYYFNINSILSLSIFSVISITAIIFYSHEFYTSYPGSQFLISFFIFLVITYFFEIIKDQKNSNRKGVRFIILMILAPLAGYFGSNISPYLGTIFLSTFFLIILFYIAENRGYNFLSLYIIFLSSFIIYTVVWNPYSSPSVFQQKNKIFARGTHLLVGDDLKKAFDDFGQIIPFIDKKDEIVNIGVSTGLFYLCNVHSYFTIVFNSTFFNGGYINLIEKFPMPNRIQILFNTKNIKEDSDSIYKNFTSFLMSKGYKCNNTVLKNAYEYTAWSK